MTPMVDLHAIVATASNAPMDWVWGTVASVLFVGVIAVPAAALNNKERRERRNQTRA